MINKKSVIRLSLLFLACLAYPGLAEEDSGSGFKGDREGHKMNDLVPPESIPSAPVLTVEKALKTFQVQDGFVIENVAAEPYVFSPVALSFDAKGRIWVAEMTRYMQDLQGSTEMTPDGTISVLQDIDGDGKVDDRQVFLNDIILPRTIAMVEGGLFYADQQQLYFAEVIEKDSQLSLGIREVVDPVYAEGGSVEHKPNTMLYGMDAWYYNAKSDKKYRTLPLDADVPAGASEIYRNKYWKLVKATTDYRGQWGLTMDDYGRLYHNGNSSPLHGEYLLPGALLHNPGYWPKQQAFSIGPANVYPARMNPGVNRGYLDGVLHTDEDNFGKLVKFTAASGSVIYRGDNFPEHYYGMGITPEPAGQLISARTIEEQQGTLSGELIFPNSELLTSTDERFRPVNLYTAPDGTLYMVDMYHGVLQHKEFLTSYLARQIKMRDLDKNNRTMGRIYRLRWRDNPAGKQPDLSRLSATELVPYLMHANGWWRDTARRLIVERNNLNAVKPIEALLANTDNQIGAINALWTLYGLDAVSSATLTQVLSSSALNQKVKLAAIAVAKKLPENQDSDFIKQLYPLIKQYPFALQAATSSAFFSSENVFDLLKRILDRHIEKPFIREAVSSGLADRAGQFMAGIGGQYPDAEFMYIIHNLGKKPAERTNKDQLSEQGKALYEQGKVLFSGRASCAGCHAQDGSGVPGLGPTFWNSEWVIDSKQKLAKVLLHGLQGPIQVGWQTWDTSAVMPGFATRADISDQDLAAIATYIRNSWGNTADTGSEVSAEFIKTIRTQTRQQNTPYKMADFDQ